MLVVDRKHVQVVVAPDSFGGTLAAAEAADAITDGWALRRPEDDLVNVPLADGGEGTLAVVADEDDEVVEVEVAGPLGRPVRARLVLRDEVAWIEAALANGLALVPHDRRDPLATTSHGVGELLEAARTAGATRVMVGVGGSATVDGGAGALTALGFRLAVEDGSGLKVGGGELAEIAQIGRDWVADEWDDVTVTVLADVATPLGEAAATFGPQKGADAAAVATLQEALATFARVVERDLAVPGLAERPATGAAGGLGFGLAAGLGARLRAGAPLVADEVGLDEVLRHADLVITGEGRIDATTDAGKVVAHVRDRAVAYDVDVAIVAGSGTLPDGVVGELSAPDGPRDPGAEVTAAAERLAGRWE